MSKIKAHLREYKQAYTYIIAIISLLAVTFTIRQQLCSLIYVLGNSMEPTLQSGDIACGLVVRDSTEIKVGDIVVFDLEGKRYIKRVVEGQGYTYQIDGDSEYTVVGENEFFVLGDNRDDSIDSRNFGPISRDCIKYKIGASFDSNVVYIVFTATACIGVVIYLFSKSDNKQPKKEKDGAEGF